MIYFLNGVITVFVIIGYIILLIASLIVSMTISNMLGLDEYTWWCFTIVIFLLLCKILFYSNSNKDDNDELI